MDIVIDFFKIKNSQQSENSRYREKIFAIYPSLSLTMNLYLEYIKNPYKTKANTKQQHLKGKWPDLQKEVTQLANELNEKLLSIIHHPGNVI